ncbi:MAG: hypothetical protein ACK46O_02835 [Flavobacteriia bacterium]
MKRLLNLLALSMLPVLGYSQLTEFDVRKMVQSAPEEQLVVESSRMLQENYFYFSEIVVDRLLEINPKSPNYNYRKGYIILDSRHDWMAALPYLMIAATDVDRNYDMYSSKETSSPTDVFYHLGRCYHLDEQIDKAKEFYTRVRTAC